MLVEFTELISYYWPKIVAGLYFSIMNTWIMAKYFKRKNILGMLITFFFISSAFISIPAELFSYLVYSKTISFFNITKAVSAPFILWNMTMDFSSVVLFMFIYAKVIKLPVIKAINIYLQYVCLERLCMVLATSAVSYLIILLISHGIIFFLIKPDLEYMTTIDTMKWGRLFLHELGLMFILDSLYSAYYIFPSIGTNVINFETIWVDVLAIITSAFILALIKLTTREGILNHKQMEYMRQFQEGQEHIIQTFAELSEAKSGETGEHVKRVAEYCKLIALKMGIDEQEAEFFRVAAMMHDVGKLLVPKEIIEKPDKLTPEEFEIVKEHTTYGNQLLSKSDGNIINIARIVAYQHHEHWDGSGYPQGLSGSDISIYAQIASVADVYDALSSKRAYKSAWKPEDAFNEILDQRGTQFSPAVVDAFTGVYGDIEDIRVRYKDAV